jgi:hypothetical protein
LICARQSAAPLCTRHLNLNFIVYEGLVKHGCFCIGAYTESHLSVYSRSGVGFAGVDGESCNQYNYDSGYCNYCFRFSHLTILHFKDLS